MERSRLFASLLCGMLVVLALLPGLLQAQMRTAHIFAQGAPIAGANGIYFDTDDQLHIASFGGSEIIVMDPNTGAIMDRYGPVDGVEGPDDIAFGPDGSLYWTSILTGRIVRRGLDGHVAQIAQLPPGANPITFSDDGRLFVALDFLGDALYELDPLGKQPPRLVIEGLGWLNGMDWGPDGFLYGPLMQKGQLVRVNVDSGELTVVAEGFGYPVAAKFDQRGQLYVLDGIPGQVMLVDDQSGNVSVVATVGRGVDNLAFDSQNRLFISNNDDGSVIEVLSDGDVRVVSPGGMARPGGITIYQHADGRERLLVADMFTLRTFDARSGVTESGAPIHLPVNTIAPAGELLVLSSWYGNVVQLWDPSTNTATQTISDLSLPLNAISFQDGLVIAELGSAPGAARIIRIHGDDLAQRTVLADASSGIIVPAGLAAAGDSLWAADKGTGSVLQLVDDGAQLHPPRVVAQGLAGPEGLAVDLDGSLLVVESNVGRLSRIDAETGSITHLTDGLAMEAPLVGAPPTLIFNGVAVSQTGTIYVAGAGQNVLYRIDQPAENRSLPVAGGGPLQATAIVLSALAVLALGLGAKLLTARPRNKRRPG